MNERETNLAAAKLIRDALAYWGGDPDLWIQKSFTDGGNRRCVNTVLSKAYGGSDMWGGATAEAGSALAVARKAIVQADDAYPEGMTLHWDTDISKATYNGADYYAICMVNNSHTFDELVAIMEKAAASLEQTASA